MSLISEALKKAQKQRTGEAPSLNEMPSVGGQSATQIRRGKSSGGPSGLLLRIGLGIVCLAVVLVGGTFLLRSKPTPEPASVPAPVASSAPAPSTATAVPPAPAATNAPATVAATTSAPAPAPVATAPTPAASQVPLTSEPAPAAAFVIPGNAAAPVTATTPAAAGRVETATVTSTPQTPVPAPIVARTEEPARPAAPLKMDSRSITFIESVRVAGIRVSSTDSKVLMNDRVYRMGDTVEHELGIRLVGIAGSALTFEDERGARYTRNF